MDLNPVRNITQSDPDGGSKAGGSGARIAPQNRAAKGYSAPSRYSGGEDSIQIGKSPLLISNLLFEKIRHHLSILLEMGTLDPFHFQKDLDPNPESTGDHIAQFAIDFFESETEARSSEFKKEVFKEFSQLVFQATQKGIQEAEEIFKGLSILDSQVHEHIAKMEKALRGQIQEFGETLK